MKFYKIITLLTIIPLLAMLSGCDKPVIQLKTVTLLPDTDRGSGNFNRMIEFCFNEDISARYYHTITIISQESFTLQGSGAIRPLTYVLLRVKDYPNCIERNLYSYINADTPAGARDMIERFIVPGNIKKLWVRVYKEKPEGDEEPMTEVIFRNI